MVHTNQNITDIKNHRRGAPLEAPDGVDALSLQKTERLINEYPSNRRAS